ncbi:hypothetical protein [Streptomyces sp. KL2]|uniref:hypothetical protein n=1 Tax=Streptomyces sp. KL2 TaxID=3050126 RepID=UPI00397AB60E
MANPVWHVGLGIRLDLEREDLGHPGLPGLWETLYQHDRFYSARRVPVEERGLQCAGVCRDQGVIAWMHLRKGSQGQRIAVHQRAEDEARHQAAETDEHKAYKERIVRVALEAGFTADTEVVARGIRTDALVEADGHRIGWEVQLSTAGHDGPRSVRARAQRAANNGITPAWHTDRRDYAGRNDTQWTRSDRLPASVIAKNRGLRVVSGYRVLEFFRCDTAADLPCPTGGVHRRCGRIHATPKVRDIMFDDMVRATAAGVVVPLEYPVGARKQRFWVPAEDRDRYLDLHAGRRDDALVGRVGQEPSQPGGASPSVPTCRPWQHQDTTPTPAPAPAPAPVPAPALVARPLPAPVPDGLPPGGDTGGIPRAVPAVTDAEARLHPRDRLRRSLVPAQRPAPLVERPAPVVDWRDNRHWSPLSAPCGHCGRSTNLRDDSGRPAHKVCHEKAVAPGTV